jgi:hypothetical protein
MVPRGWRVPGFSVKIQQSLPRRRSWRNQGRPAADHLQRGDVSEEESLDMSLSPSSSQVAYIPKIETRF